MFLEVDPGDGKPLPEDGRIQVSNTLPDIDPDEFLSALDSDTRNYLKLLISGAGKGLDGRGTDLREVLKRLGPLHKDLARVSRAVAERRHNLRRLVNRYGLLMTELGKSDKDITRLVRASNVDARRVRRRGPEHLGARVEAARHAEPDRVHARQGRHARRSRWARPSRRCARRSASSTTPTRRCCRS